MVTVEGSYADGKKNVFVCVCMCRWESQRDIKDSECKVSQLSEKTWLITGKKDHISANRKDQ